MVAQISGSEVIEREIPTAAMFSFFDDDDDHGRGRDYDTGSFTQSDFGDTGAFEEEEPERRRFGNLRFPGRAGGRRGIDGGSRAARAPRRAGGGSFTSQQQVQRIGGVVLALVVISIVAIFWIRSCQRSAEKRSYRNFVKQLDSVVAESNSVGTKLQASLGNSTAGVAGLSRSLATLAAAQKQAQTDAQKLSGPGATKDVLPQFVDAMRLRADALGGLAAAVATSTTGTGDNIAVKPTSASVAALQYQRLIAADVIYRDVVANAVTAALQAKKITGTGTSVSSSVWVRSGTGAEPKLADISGMTSLLTALSSVTTSASGTATCATLCGTRVDSTSIAANNGAAKALQVGGINTVSFNGTTPKSIVVDVAVRNSGTIPVTQVKVNVTLGTAKQTTQTIPSIAVGEVGHARFTVTTGMDVSAAQQKLLVTVAKVPGEKNLSNNVARYNVAFTL